MLLRTFSKVYGLCGLRVGYALCGSEDFRTAVDQVRQPFFCNAAAQAAALEALNHQDEVARRVERNLAERIGLEDGLRGLGIEPAESQANFVWFDLPARSVGRGASVDVAGSPSAACSCAPATSLGRAGALRVTVGTEAENERFLEALGALLVSVAPRGCHDAPTHRRSARAPLSAAYSGVRRRLRRIPPGDLARRSAGDASRRPHTGLRVERRSATSSVPCPVAEFQEYADDDRDEADGDRGGDPGRHRPDRELSAPAPTPRAARRSP